MDLPWKGAFMTKSSNILRRSMVKILWNGRPLNSPWALPYPTDHSDSCNNIFQLIYMQIHADKRAAILKFDIRKTADRKRAIFRRIPARRGRWSWFVINPWKDNDEIMNIWKSYMWTAEWRIIWRKVIAVANATYACSCEKKAWKQIQAVNVDHAQELTGMGKRSTDIAFFCVFWINTIK